MAKEVKINYGTTDLMLYKYDRQNNLQYDLLYMYIYFKIYTLQVSGKILQNYLVL